MLVIGHQWPEPDATAAGQRMLWLLRGFQRAGYSIVFACSAGAVSYGADLGSMGIETAAIRLNDSSFDRFLQDRGFTLVLFDRFPTEEQFSWRVHEALPKALLVLDTEDLHSLRHSREQALVGGRPWNPSEWVRHPLFFREVASMFRADLSLIVSGREMELLVGQVPLLEPRLLYLPLGMEPVPKAGQPGFEARKGFVFIGNGKHRPNLDAIRQLKTDLWPRIRKHLQEASLLICGAYLPQQVFQLHDPGEGFLVQGWAPDLQAPLGSARLQLAPLRFGAGIKGKVLDAARFGLPTVGTASAFEGILGTAGPHPFLAGSNEDFIRKAVALYRDPGLWKESLKVQQEACEVHTQTSFQPLADALGSLKERHQQPPGQARILEKLLRSEAFGRLRYLSKWIEAKEKRGD